MNSTLKDPVCGMSLQADRALSAFYQEQEIHFCSEFCRYKFFEHPEIYTTALVTSSDEGNRENRKIAYFSMEVAVGSAIPSYSGGLGVLAGDTLKSCADLQVPIVGVSLLYHQGYFEQVLDDWGAQEEKPVQWEPERFLRLLTESITVTIEQRLVRVRAWQYDIVGLSGYTVPLIFLDTRVEENAEFDRTLTDTLYGGDETYRFAQETLLGIGGIRMLETLGYQGIERFHMNEGHASLLVLELLSKQHKGQTSEWDYNSIRSQCVFTTHTPVPAGHDQFQYDLVQSVGEEIVPLNVLQMLAGDDCLNMTVLGLNLSHYVNGVAKRHEEVSQIMFPAQPIHHITNGVHSWTWTCDSFRILFDRYIPGWSKDPAMLRHAIDIPKTEIWQAHIDAKTELLELIKVRTNCSLEMNVMTVGFARRSTSYKRVDLIFSDINRLREITDKIGRLQFVFAGKAHPKDDPGKELIRRIFRVANQLKGEISVVFLQNYDLDLARILVSGVDLWLNTPQRPLEASGTSGMKAAHNGVPSFSVPDGWWIEGYIDGVTGWSVGSREQDASDLESLNQADGEDLYWKIENLIAPMFYRERKRWIDVMRQSIALNASFFNTHRMVQQYVTNAYLSRS
ncbi:alpha-glucan family phosphorylase [Acaryochloris sp. CCMEE 5410]|uniref:alpha-glucan family phosphorylase n=1 Tax=Acaryochloris sp. CCMEE 5410 TaxID=310037 RepID=UPI00024843E5|nr:alpha-glucan family phosphorylase [Acaryochloris sp. CCMEE 5410]KAI9129926.1 alpha-glucan family phosphorylase [Acaryochloris sp. CCMEE 5410]